MDYHMNNADRKKNIAIMGGTFNPIHNGHIALAKAAYEQFDINEVLVMPSGDPSSYKNTSDMVNAYHRCNMVQLAIKDFPYMKLSKLEVERVGKTYTSDTLKEVKKIYNKIYFIIGADSLFNLEKWHEASYVMNNCHFLAANRNECDEEQIMLRINYLRNNYYAEIDLLKLGNQPFSSTAIRENLRDGKDISGMVDDSVEKYIYNNNLYL